MGRIGEAEGKEEVRRGCVGGGGRGEGLTIGEFQGLGPKRIWASKTRGGVSWLLWVEEGRGTGRVDIWVFGYLFGKGGGRMGGMVMIRGAGGGA